MSIGCEHIILQEQYRMHPEISFFPSHRFYKGQLVDAALGADCLERNRGIPPYFVVDVAGGLEHSSLAGNSDSTHVKNVREANAVVEFAVGIATLTKQTVAVLSFFAGQVELITRLLGEQSASRCAAASLVSVFTVDGFQGSEADVVLLSFARANSGRRLGFLKDFRRLNVALTRARRVLAIFANVALLSSQAPDPLDDVTALFTDAASRGMVLSIEGAQALLRAAGSGDLAKVGRWQDIHAKVANAEHKAKPKEPKLCDPALFKVRFGLAMEQERRRKRR